MKNIIQSFRWLKILFSPFTPFKLKLYVGKTQIGCPYFLPRRWVKSTHKLRTEAVLDHIERTKKWNELNPKHAHTIRSFEELYEEYRGHTFPVLLKVGFDYCSVGWKTKWDEYDIRHEWNPVYTFVFFGYQIALTVYHEYHSHFWEAWICYEYKTDKSLSKKERVAFCREKCPQIWKSRQDGEEIIIDYYTKVVKSKYL